MKPKNEKLTFILVHGAWHGGWCWRKVKDYLLERGHRVFTPTLTGLGEKSHLRNPDINLDTHIQDLENLIKWEELEKFVLVGHSYGGVIISAICDNNKDKVSHAIFLDAIVPNDGDTIITGGTKKDVELRFGPLTDGYLIPPRDPTNFGIPINMKNEIEWVKRLVTPHLVGTWIQPIRLKNGGSKNIPRTYIFCADREKITPKQKEKLDAYKKDPSWNYRELTCGHDAMVIMPEETGNLFENISKGI